MANRGRPPSDDPLQRARAVRFTASEEALVEQAASEAGMKLAPWIRARALTAARAELGAGEPPASGEDATGR